MCVALTAPAAVGQVLGDDIMLPPAPPLDDSQYAEIRRGLSILSSDPESLSSAPAVISLLLLHDPSLDSAVEVLESLVAKTNDYYADSEINVEFTIAAIAAISNTSGSNSSVLGQITETAGTPLSEEVADLRELHSADMVAFIRAYDGGSSCGSAWLIGSGFTPTTNYTKTYAVSVTMTGRSGFVFCADDTLAHELGHNFGVQHDRANAFLAPRFPYGYGYGFSGQFGTIMSYISPSVTRFSNPGISDCNDNICGDASEADVARAINEVSVEFASIYPNETPPEAPSITDVTVAVDSISLALLPGSDGGSPILSYTVYCDNQTETSSSSPIVLSDLEPDTEYDCAASSRNALGESPRSSVTAVRTDAILPAEIIEINSYDEEISLRVEPHVAAGGYTVLGYTASCGLQTATSTSTLITVTGLTNEQAYSCSVVVNTDLGSSTSSTSVSATPATLPAGLRIFLLQTIIDQQRSAN